MESAYADLVRREALLSQDVLSYLPDSWQGQFFCLDERTWVWSETIGSKEVTVRYRLFGQTIYKQRRGQNEWCQLSLTEAKNLQRAVELYNQRVVKQLYTV